MQIHSGLAGMIVVEDDISKTPQHLLDVSCPLNCQHEVRLLFQPTLMYRNTDYTGFAHMQTLIEDHAAFRLVYI